MIIEDMRSFANVKFIDTSLPYRIHKNERSNKLEVCFKNVSPLASSESESCDIYDTVLQAVGRTPNTSILNLQQLGIKTNPSTKKVPIFFYRNIELSLRGISTNITSFDEKIDSRWHKWTWFWKNVGWQYLCDRRCPSRYYFSSNLTPY